MAKRSRTYLPTTRLALELLGGQIGEARRERGGLRWSWPNDLCPQPRHPSVSSQAIGVTRDRRNASQLRLALEAAPDFLLDRRVATELIVAVVESIRSTWWDACEEARLTLTDRELLWGREILNEYIFRQVP